MQQLLDTVEIAVRSLSEYNRLFLLGGVLVFLALVVEPLLAKLLPRQLGMARGLMLILLVAALIVLSFGARVWLSASGPSAIDPAQLGL
jgi:hypothetical protein